MKINPRNLYYVPARNSIGFAIFIIFSSIIFFPFPLAAQTVFSWQDCVREAKTNHPDLLSSRESINQTKADKNTAISGFLPKIDSDVGVLSSRSSTSSRSENYSYGLSGSQLLFDGFKTSNQVKAAEQQITAAQFNYMVTSSNVRLRLRQAFVDLLKEKQLLKISEAIAARRKQSLDLVNLRYEAGREHKGALLLAQANLVQAQADVAKAKRDIGVSQRRLNKELGRDEFSEIAIDGNFVVAEIEPQEPPFEGLAKGNPFLQKLMTLKDAAKSGLSSAKAEYFPEIFAGADIGRSESRWPPGGESSFIGVTVTLPLFDGGSRRASVQKAKATLSKAKADERSGRDGVILTLHETWAFLQDAMDQVKVEKGFLDADEARVKIGEAQYSNGLVTFDDWIIIEDALVSTQKSFLEAQANALIAEADWVQAKGGTLENEK